MGSSWVSLPGIIVIATGQINLACLIWPVTFGWILQIIISIEWYVDLLVNISCKLKIIRVESVIITFKDLLQVYRLVIRKNCIICSVPFSYIISYSHFEKVVKIVFNCHVIFTIIEILLVTSLCQPICIPSRAWIAPVRTKSLIIPRVADLDKSVLLASRAIFECNMWKDSQSMVVGYTVLILIFVVSRSYICTGRNHWIWI